MHEPKRIESRRQHDGSWYCVDSHVIGAPADAVFDVLADLPGYARWWPGVSIRVDSKGDRTAPGTRGTLGFRSGLCRFACEFVVEEVVAGKKVRLLLASGGAAGPITLTASRVDESCRASIIWEGVKVEAPLARLVIRFLGPRSLHASSVRGLKGLERFVAEKRRREPGGTKRAFEWRGPVPGEKGA